MTDMATWALVCDAARARIVRDLGAGVGEVPPEVVSRARSSHLRRFLADPNPPSPAPARRGRGPSGDEAAGPLIDDMRDFGRDTLAGLDQQFRIGAFRRLALFAPPRMLGVLQTEMPETLRGAVVLARAVDLVGLSESDLRDRVLRSLEKAGEI